jgi:hypothetical protein
VTTRLLEKIGDVWMKIRENVDKRDLGRHINYNPIHLDATLMLGELDAPLFPE